MAPTGTPSRFLERFVNLARLVPLATNKQQPADQTTTPRIAKLTAAQRVAVMRAYQGGQSICLLAREYRTSSKSTIPLIIEKGTDSLGTTAARPKQQIKEAIRIYDQGWSTARIADRFSFDQSTVYRHLKKRGVVMRIPNDR